MEARLTEGWADGCMMSRWIAVWVGGRVDECTDGSVPEWVDEWMNGGRDESTDGSTRAEMHGGLRLGV